MTIVSERELKIDGRMANDVKKNSGLPRPLGERNECAVAIDDPRGVGVWFPILSGTPSFVSDPALQ